MPKIIDQLGKVNFFDKQFVGTIALKSEEISLPNGSKMALGIDDGHWILIYQSPEDKHFQVFKYSYHDKQLHVDQKVGGKEEYKTFRQHVEYFLSHARIDDLITIRPGGQK